MNYDVIVVGAGASGMVAAIFAARAGKSVLLLERMPKVGLKLKATGGGRCNLTNRCESDEFMQSFGKQGRFMQDALNFLDNKKVIKFFNDIGVDTDAPDGFRVFPVGHNSATVLNGLTKEISKLNIKVKTSHEVLKIVTKNAKVIGLTTTKGNFNAKSIILATGGLGYSQLGSKGDGYKFAKDLGHTIKPLHPAMMPLITKEKWVANCRADTVAKVTMQVDIKKYKRYKAVGDLIFTKDGIRGPVVLDFSREITPLLAKFSEVPIVVNLTKGANFDSILKLFKEKIQKQELSKTLELVELLLPTSIAKEIIKLSGANEDIAFNKLAGATKDKLINLLVHTPLTIIGHNGFKMAMITRGGVSLKEVNPKNLESKIVSGLHFCGELLDLDGPCGGYNLQWAFSSGALAGSSA